jgi:hypothetical protein
LAEALNATARGDAENGSLFCAENNGGESPRVAAADIFRELCL